MEAGERSRPRAAAARGGAAGACFLLAAAAAVFRRGLTPAPAVSLAVQNAYTIEATNRETRHAGAHPGRGYPGLSEGEIVEPGLATSLTVKGPGVPEDVRWTISSNFQEARSYGGRSVDHVFADAGQVEVEASFAPEGGASGDSAVTITRSFSARYVRRSLRGLTEEGRDAFFAAIAVTASISTVEGQRIYGASYHNLSHFVQTHLATARAGPPSRLRKRHQNVAEMFRSIPAARHLDVWAPRR